MERFDLLQPTGVDEAIVLLAQHGEDARLIAGGAMLMPLLRQRVIAPRYLVSVVDIPGLSAIELRGDGLVLGAAATLRAIERSVAVRGRYPVLSEALRLVGNVRVRNVATIGGHLAQADIHLDLPPVLLALDASVRTRSPRGERLIPLEDLFLGYYETCLAADEMIVSVHLPAPSSNLYGAYLKYCSLSPNDWPTVGVAAFLKIDNGRVADARLVVGCVSDRPLRVPSAEVLLRGERPARPILAEAARRYAAAAEPVADIRGSVDYKRRVTEVYVRRAIEAAAARAGASIQS